MIRRLKTTPELVWKAMSSFLLRFSGLLIQFIGSIIIARQLGVESYGAYAYAFTWVTLFGMVLSLGMGELSVREIPGLVTNGEIGELWRFLRAVAVTVLATAAVVALLLMLLENTGVLVLAPGWILVALAVLIQGVALTSSKVLNGFHRIVVAQFLDTALRPGIFLLIVLGAIMAGVALSPERLFLIVIVAALPIILLMGVLLVRSYRRERGDQATYRSGSGLWFYASLPLLLTSFTNLLQTDLDVLMVGTILGDAEVGLYRAAARAAALAGIANMIAIQVLGPMLSRALARKDRDEAQLLLSQAAVVSFGLGMTICIVLGLGAATYLGLFGPGFVEARGVLRLLLVGQVVAILCGGVGMVLVMLSRERLVLMANGAAIVLNFGLNLLLIHPLGIEGAAIATLMSMIFVKLALLAVVLRRRHA